MFTRSSLRPALVVGVVVAATTWFVTRAGDLNPPPGPVQPSMISLADIYNRMSTQENCPSCVWNYKFVSWQTLQGASGQVLVGSGVLHAVVAPGGGGGLPVIYDWVQSGDIYPVDRQILRIPNSANSEPPTPVVLDVRFTDGIFLSGASNFDTAAGITLIYRLDR